MNQCVHLKVKLNHKLECKLQKKIINIKDCTNCKDRNNIYKDKNTIKKKSSKLAKLENKRYSVFTENMNQCYLCPSTYQITKHEVFSGRNRQHSIVYGFVLPLCLKCHEEVQENKDFKQYWQTKCREHWLKNYGTLEDFIKVFGKSYL